MKTVSEYTPIEYKGYTILAGVDGDCKVILNNKSHKFDSLCEAKRAVTSEILRTFRENRGKHKPCQD